jgi:hypothetical protein
MMARSISLIDTGGSLMPSTQADSHGAGHTRPVNSGKLFVACNAGSPPATGPVRQVVPVRNDVVQRASGVAERHAAIHAARALRSPFRRKRLVDLEPVVDPFLHRPPRGHLAAIFHETSDLTHGQHLLSRLRRHKGASRPLGTPSTRLNSCGNTFTNRGSMSPQFSRIHLRARAARQLACRSIRFRSALMSLWLRHRFQVHARAVARLRQNSPLFVEHIRDAAAHARGEVRPVGPAPPPGRSSCTRSHDRPRLPPPPWRRSCAPRNARRPSR